MTTTWTDPNGPAGVYQGLDPRQCSTECWCAGSAESTAKGIPSPSAPFPLPFNVLHHRPPISLPALDPACLFHALVDPYWMPLVHLIGRPLVHRLVSRFVLGSLFPPFLPRFVPRAPLSVPVSFPGVEICVPHSLSGTTQWMSAAVPSPFPLLPSVAESISHVTAAWRL